MYNTPRTIEQILTLLDAAPTRLANLTEGLPCDAALAGDEELEN